MTTEYPREQYTLEDIRAKLEELHEQGILDLDAPARNLIEIAELRMNEFAQDSEEPGKTKDSYWFIGSKGAFHK